MSSNPSTPMDGAEQKKEKDEEGRAGACGSWQGLVYAALGIVYMRGVWPIFASIFFNYDPGHRCATATGVEWNSSSLPESEMDWGQCTVFVNVTHSNATHSCPLGWEFLEEGSATSIVTEWGLVCDQAWQGELATTLYMVGTALTTPLTPLSDRLGRRPFLLGCLGVQVALGLGLYWAPSIAVFIVFRFFTGLANAGTGLSTYILMTESVPRQLRTLPAVGMSVLWAAGIMLLALLGFLLPQWRHLQLALALFNLPCMLLVLLVPESIPWLLAMRRRRQTERIARRILKFNGLDPSNTNMAALVASLGGNLESRDEDSAEEHEQTRSKASGSHNSAPTQKGRENPAYVEDYNASNDDTNNAGRKQQPSPEQTAVERKHDDDKGREKRSKGTCGHQTDATAKELFANSRMRLYTVIIFFLFLVNSLSYFGISLSTPSLHGDRFLNLMLSGAVEVPAYIICGLCTHRWGRRRPMCMFMAICAVMNIAAAVVPESTGEGWSLGWLKTTLVMIGKFGVSGSYATVYLLGAEVFPTAIRNQALGFASFFENVGFIAAPLTVFAARTLWLIPVVTYGVATGVGAGLVLLLPETNQRALPSTVDEVTGWDKVGSEVNKSQEDKEVLSSAPYNGNMVSATNKAE